MRPLLAVQDSFKNLWKTWCHIFGVESVISFFSNSPYWYLLVWQVSVLARLRCVRFCVDVTSPLIQSNIGNGNKRFSYSIKYLGGSKISNIMWIDFWLVWSTTLLNEMQIATAIDLTYRCGHKCETMTRNRAIPNNSSFLTTRTCKRTKRNYVDLVQLAPKPVISKLVSLQKFTTSLKRQEINWNLLYLYILYTRSFLKFT